MPEDIKETVEAEVVSDQPKAHSKKNRKSEHRDDNWNVSKIFWGLLFIVIGALVLLANFDIITVDWGNIWRLWPILIISCGLSILSFRNLIWRLASILLVIMTMGLIVFVATADTELLTTSSRAYISSIEYKNNNIKKSVVNIEAGASDITFGSKDQNSLVTTSFKSNIAKLETSSDVDGTTQTTNLSMNTKNGQWFNVNFNSDFDIYVDRTAITDAVIHAGASSINVDTSFVKLNSLTIKSGASSIDVKLGQELDNSNLSIESGVSSIKVRVPKSVGIKLNIESGLASNNLSDLSKTSDDTYESSNYSQSSKKITISTKIGVSSFEIERY